jgi:site-specific recombinase XerD
MSDKKQSSRALVPTKARALTAKEFLDLADVPPEIEWFANITNPQTRRAYQNDLKDFMRFARITNPEVFRVVTRAHLIAWRKDLERRGCEGSTIQRKLWAVSSLFEYLCERHAVVHNPVKGVKRPKATVYEGLTLALSDEQARLLLQAPAGETLKAKRDRAILTTLWYHGLRREELCRLRARDLQQREGVLHFRVHGKGDKVRYIPVGLKAQRLITEYLEASGHKEDLGGALFWPVKNNTTKTLAKHLHSDSVYQGIVK